MALWAGHGLGGVPCIEMNVVSMFGLWNKIKLFNQVMMVYVDGRSGKIVASFVSDYTGRTVSGPTQR